MLHVTLFIGRIFPDWAILSSSPTLVYSLAGDFFFCAGSGREIGSAGDMAGLPISPAMRGNRALVR
jgi:hypothetical protein